MIILKKIINYLIEKFKILKEEVNQIIKLNKEKLNNLKSEENKQSNY